MKNGKFGNLPGPGPGRPQGSKNKETILREQAREDGKQKMVDAFVGAVEVLVGLLGAEDPEIRRKAAESIIDRVDGKPKQSVDVAGSMDAKVAVQPLTADEVGEILRRVKDGYDRDKGRK